MYAAIASSLAALGIPPRLAEVYVFVVQRGDVVARDVADAFSLTRSTAHDVLSMLVKYGFARATVCGKEKRFCMESPHVIRNAFEVERRKAETRSEVFENIAPMLRAFHSAGNSGTGIRYFSGIEGLREIQREFDGLPGDIIQLLDHDTFCALEIARSQDVRQHRLIDQQKRVRSLLLTDQTTESLSIIGTEVRTISRSLVTAPGEMSVCDDRVLLLSYEDDISVIEIRSRAIAEVCRATLELAWKAAEHWGTALSPSKQ